MPQKPRSLISKLTPQDAGEASRIACKKCAPYLANLRSPTPLKGRELLSIELGSDEHIATRVLSWKDDIGRDTLLVCEQPTAFP